MAEFTQGFFSEARASAELGLAVFLNAGDPPLPVLKDCVAMLDESGIGCLELAVPFPDSPTDGPVVRRSADRALAEGVGLAETLAFVAAVRPSLKRLRIALLADWSHTLRTAPPADYARDVADSGVDALLAHGLPPRLRPAHHEALREAGLPEVTTCYPASPPATVADAAAHATGYLYLIARYGRSGSGTPAAGHAGLAPVVGFLRDLTSSPIAVGFGVSTAEDLASVALSGADAAIVGSAGVAVVERARETGANPVDAYRSFIASLTTTPTSRGGYS
ncbi:tryptophan synthase subunit alpha [Streptomyces diastaticus]|uniref:tryptophan synthase subunit alpha n=1 Tax=Streptomyces TaxID=1883 RepID=UPI000C26AB40|nr:MULTISPECIES: tryptophan synthase subunit alpha [unclassified Streptomyces]NEE38459.1 tryptophan synthase subunit alpha [Streptomyces sp. SID7982]PJM81424.1 tryptophan synthase subunit alpha [Streptomyces sp. TSRI0384-2]RPK86986.1 Tryptophan synthase alpha chain [Streptomyces sp. ADI98-12]